MYVTAALLTEVGGEAGLNFGCRENIFVVMRDRKGDLPFPHSPFSAKISGNQFCLKRDHKVKGKRNANSNK